MSKEMFEGFRNVLIEANRAGNKKAINEDMCSGAGAIGYLPIWKATVSKLRTSLIQYNKLYHAHNLCEAAKDEQIAKELEEKYNECFKHYKEVMYFCGGFKVSEAQMRKLTGYIDKFCTDGETGTYMAVKGEQAFRKSVEQMIGCILTGKEIAGEKDDELIKTYNTNKRMVERLTKEIAEKEKERAAAQHNAEECEGFGEMKSAALFKNKAEDIEKKKKELQAKIDKANKDNEAIEEDYKEALVRLKYARA